MVEGTTPLSSSVSTERRDMMLAPDEVTAMIRLQALGWGSKRIARELGCDRKTVKRYLRCGGWQPYRLPHRAGRLEDLMEWLAERFRRHRGNADVVRQELADEHGVQVSLRTVERAVQGLRQELEAESKATVRFETAPGQQLQIDFGTTTVMIGGERVRVHLFVATLGYSRRNFVAAFRHERQSAWITGLEAAFRHFGGVPREVLYDYVPGHIIVTQHSEYPAEVAEGVLVGLQKRLLGGVAVGAVKGAAAGHRAHAEDLQLDALAIEVGVSLVPVDLGFLAPIVGLRHEGLPADQAERAFALMHIVAHRALRDGRLRHLLADPLPDPARRVSLLARRAAVGLQNGVDEHGNRPQHRLDAFLVGVLGSNPRKFRNVGISAA